MLHLRELWSRTKAFLARLFRRKPPEPGRFETGGKGTFRGFLAVAPWILPQRDYLVYVPKGHANGPNDREAPLIVLIHGCQQTPEDIAAGTRIANTADDLGCLVLLPRQKNGANRWGCWNWYDGGTTRGWGETAIVAAQIEEVRERYRIDRRRVFVAGMSSGGGLAAILGLRRPDLVAGTFIHSGIACGAASSPYTALSVISNGADTDVAEIGADARAAADPTSLPVPLIAIQGSLDTAVPPINAVQLVRQYLALNAHPAATSGDATELPPPDHVATTTTDGRPVTTSEWNDGRRLVARHVLIDGLGHAWSGGDEQHPYHDAQGPDATALLGAFVRSALS
ncbi:MAG: PHB depolymerase family esterase [Betaproteobacteria bacterium]|nr:PHB depolymerase family esterase [Betaproteobacteria bacterium]